VTFRYSTLPRLVIFRVIIEGNKTAAGCLNPGSG
jgi:hypothetical protein